MISMEDPIWFSPANVIYHGNLLRDALSETEKKSKKFRKVVEAVTVAQMLVGMMIKEGREYWMQLVDDENGSPDIRTIRYADDHDDKFDFLEQVDVEVVEYESHTTLSIPDFIVQKKLSKNKGYDEKTIILCHIGKDEAYLPDGDAIKKAMSNVKSKCAILLLVGANPQATEVKLITLNPKVGVLHQYNPIQELLKMKLTSGVVHFRLGTRKPPTHNKDDKHYPFEKLGYVPDSSGDY